MIKATIVMEQNELSFEMNGSTKVLAAEAAMLIGQVYEGIAKNDMIMAELFKGAIIRCINDPECPVWNPVKEGEPS